MRYAAFTLLTVLAATACDAPHGATPTARAPLTDLTATSTLAPVRAAFNAHKGEARFLTLLSPT